jgi:NTE family protein
MKIDWKSNGDRIGPKRPHERIALVLQGGGALGAYQAGAFEALADTEWLPDWVVGVSIGAINAAIIAGNPPLRRVERLAEFWHLITSGMTQFTGPATLMPWLRAMTENGEQRSVFHQFSAWHAAWLGIPGFFQPRLPPPPFQPDGTSGALSLYDTSPLRATLESVIDFDLINDGDIRLSLGTVNVRTGNSHYFDNRDTRIGPEHVMASGALPPSFPPMMIDGEAWWDGGILSNTPLQHVLDVCDRDESLLVFQVDLFNARGEVPKNFDDVMKRHKDILYSSRTRYTSNMAAELANTRRAISDLIAKLPAHLLDDPQVLHLQDFAQVAPVDIVHLIYRQGPFERESKDYEFSRATMLERWKAGRRDLGDTLAHPDWLKFAGRESGVTQYDLTRHSRKVSAGAE